MFHLRAHLAVLSHLVDPVPAGVFAYVVGPFVFGSMPTVAPCEPLGEFGVFDSVNFAVATWATSASSVDGGGASASAAAANSSGNSFRMATPLLRPLPSGRSSPSGRARRSPACWPPRPPRRRAGRSPRGWP